MIFDFVDGWGNHAPIYIIWENIL